MAKKKTALKKKPIPDPCNERLAILGKFWCDNFTDVYIGDCNSISAKPVASHEYNKTETSDLDTTAKCCDYLYFVCWSDNRVLNGFLAEISGNPNALSDDRDWEVFATGITFNSKNPRPTRDSVLAQIKKADCHYYWTKPALGPKNTTNTSPWGLTGFNISPNANFIWFDSGLDTSPTNPPAPFSGFNHKEYLIFRLPVKKLFPKECAKCKCEDCECCDCCCSGCNTNASAQELALANRADAKFNTIPGSSNVASLCSSSPTAPKECKSALAVKSLNLCFFLHWGDSASDQIENTDCYETLFLRVCNPYADLLFKNLCISKVTILPNATTNQMQLVPDSLICFDCLAPCSCKSREFALNTKNVPPGKYSIEVEYCVDEVCVTMDASGNTSFPITVIQD